MRWAGRLVATFYLAFFLFFLLAQVFGREPDEPKPLTSVEVGMFIAIGVSQSACCCVGGNHNSGVRDVDWLVGVDRAAVVPDLQSILWIAGGGRSAADCRHAA